MSRWVLSADKIPSAWFNVAPHLTTPLQPPLHPVTRQPVGPDDLTPLFPSALIEQEMATAPWIDVPGEILDILRLWRPTPLVRATQLEQALGTPARIYFKDESGSPAGSHEAAIQFARVEGKLAAPEAAHAIRAVIDEALVAKETGEEKVILFNYCGHGFLDLSAYDDYLHGRLPGEQG